VTGRIYRKCEKQGKITTENWKTIPEKALKSWKKSLVQNSAHKSAWCANEENGVGTEKRGRTGSSHSPYRLGNPVRAGTQETPKNKNPPRYRKKRFKRPMGPRIPIKGLKEEKKSPRGKLNNRGSHKN